MQHTSSRRPGRTSSRHFTLVLIVVALALSGLPAPPVSAAPIVVLNTNDSADGSLRKAIADSLPGSTILFDSALSGDTILLTEPLVVPHDLTIDGSALDVPLTLDGQGAERVLEVEEDATVTLRGLAILGGFHTVEGGGILNRGTLTVDSCDLEGNRVEGPLFSSAVGGAISNHGDLTVTDSSFVGNAAGDLQTPPFATQTPGHGGAIYNDTAASLTIERSTFLENNAYGRGGAIHTMGALWVSDSTFDRCASTAGDGGAISVDASVPATVQESLFEENSASPYEGVGGAGGAIVNDSALTVTASEFISNTAPSGGALRNGASGVVDVSGSAFYENDATSGAGIANAGIATITASEFLTNTADSGAGLANLSGATMAISGSLLRANHVLWYGGIINEGELTVADSSLIGNSAMHGGGLANGGPATITGSTLADNTAVTGGGAIFSFAAITVTNSTLSDNSAGNYGGGIAAVESPVTLTASTLVGNSAPQGAGLQIYPDVEGPIEASIANSILAHSSGGGLDCDIYNDMGTISLSSHNLIMTGNCAADPAPDPLLGPLADNGGPTETFALLVGSPALNAGDPAYCPDVDQRGVARPQGAACDIGAFEMETPGARTDAAQGVTASSATLYGAVLPRGWEATASFEVGKTTAYGTTLPASPDPLTGTAEIDVSAALGGLDPSTTYHYRAVAESAVGTAYGEDLTFTTSRVTPTVVTGGTSAVTSTGATLLATVNPYNAPSTVTFEYGYDDDYGASVAVPGTVDGLDAVPVMASLTGLFPNTTYHYRAVATNGHETGHGEDETFTTAKAAPLAVTVPAEGVAGSEATLRGTVNAHNDKTTVAFEYRLLSAEDWETVPATPGTVRGVGATPVSATLTGLLPNTLYQYRVVAANSAGTARGETLPLTAARAAPLAATDAAEAVTTEGATLRGRVTAQNEETAVRFRYGLSTAYGTLVSAAPPTVDGMDLTPVSLAVGGLLPNTEYHYRVEATNGAGTTVGGDETFTTLPVPPTATTREATGVTDTGAILHATVNARNAATAVTFAYGPRGGATVSAPAAPATATGLGDTAVMLTLTGLAPETEYVYRVVAENAAGETVGEEATFTTSRVEHRLALPLLRR